MGDKQIINCQSDLNQLVPFKYRWAWDKYLAACAPITGCPMKLTWLRMLRYGVILNGLTEDERIIMKRNLGFFSTADSLVANNLVLSCLSSHYES